MDNKLYAIQGSSEPDTDSAWPMYAQNPQRTGRRELGYNFDTLEFVEGEGSADNDSFSIINGALFINSPADYETKNSYTIRLRASRQSGISIEKALTINIEDVNEAPTDILLDNITVAEDLSTGETIGTLVMHDPDLDTSSNFELYEGDGDASNSYFQIIGNQLILASPLDYENQTDHSIRIKGSDQGGLEIEKIFLLTVEDVNEFPELNTIGNITSSVDKTVTLQLTASDADGDALTFIPVVRDGDITATLDGNLLMLEPSSGWLGTASITVSVIDGNGGQDSETFLFKVEKLFNSDRERQEVANDLAANPSDPVANYHAVFWDLADLVESTRFKTLLNTFGVSSEVFNFSATEITDEDQLPEYGFELNENFDLQDLRSYILEEFIPLLDTFDARFATIQTGQTATLYEEYDFGDAIIVDYADSLVLRSITHLLRAWILVELAYDDYAFQIKDYSNAWNSGVLTSEYLRVIFPNSGKVVDASLLQAASADLQAAIDLYQNASPLLRDTLRTQALLTLQVEDLQNEAEFMDNLVKLEQTLTGTHPWGDDVANLVFVNLKPFFEGNLDFTNLFPRSVGNKFWDEPLPDPTLGGIFPGMTDNRARDYIRQIRMFSDNLWLGTEPMEESLRRNYGKDFKGTLVHRTDSWSWYNFRNDPGHWWRSHWFGLFYRPAAVGWYEFDQRTFPTEWMYHLWLGWVYPGEATPDSVWFWQQSSESWMWTNRDTFPVMYSHSSGLWFYVDQKDGSQYLWVNNEWVKFK